MTLNEIAYDLISIVRPQLSDDSEISLDQIKWWIANQRALYIRNELNKNRTIDNDIVQTICAEVELVDASDCCDIDLGCDILRTKKKVPTTIEMHNRQAIVRVGPLNKKKRPFSFVEYERIPWVGSGRFNRDNIFAFLHGGYIYVHSKDPKNSFMEAITIRGVFEDPTAAAEFKNCGTACYSDDDTYPIKAWMIPAMKDTILKSNLLIEAQAEVQAADEANDASSAPKPVQ